MLFRMSAPMFVSMSVLVLALGGCASLRAPVVGAIYSDTSSAVAATSSQSGNRVGEACAASYLGLIAIGDASIEAARRNGAVTLITSVDQTTTNYFVFYSKYCTIVRGR